MPSLYDIKVSFDTMLQDNWTATPIAFDNTDTYKKGSVPWLNAVLLPSITTNADLNGLERHYGIYRISVFVPLFSGTKDAYTYAEQLRALFTNQLFDQIVCYAAEIRRVGDNGNGWFMMNVLVNFWSDQ
jgi:hypothetical protein